MQHPHEVDRGLAVLDTQEMVVYGPDLPRPLGTDGEAMPRAVASIPIGRPASADVLKAYFAACGSVTWAKVLEAGRQVPRLERGMAAAPRRTQAWATACSAIATWTARTAMAISRPGRRTI